MSGTDLRRKYQMMRLRAGDYCQMEQAEEMGPAITDSSPWEKPWHEADWFLPTRNAAIVLMLKFADIDGNAS